MKMLPLIAVFLGALLAPVLPASAADNIYGPAQSDMDKERQQQEERDNQQSLYERPFNFDFGNGEEKKDEPKAINPYSKKYKKQVPLTDKQKEDKAARSLLPNFIYASYFVREPGLKPGEVKLRTMVPAAITGCLKLKQPSIEVRKNTPKIDLIMKEAEIRPDKTKRYPQFECDQRNQYAQVDIILNRDELIEGGYNKIGLRNSGLRFLDVDLEVDENKITATGKSSACIPNAGGSTTYWFYPQNTIVLGQPGTEPNDETKGAIRTAAKKAGLIPLEDVISDFRPSDYAARNMYFVDKAGKYVKEINTAGRPILFDTVSASETYYGANGPYNRPKDIHVYAKLPEAYD